MAPSVRFAALLAVAVPIAPVAAADGPAAVLGNYADIAQAMYGDALVRAGKLDQAVAVPDEDLALVHDGVTGDGPAVERFAVEQGHAIACAGWGQGEKGGCAEQGSSEQR